jgi:ribosomal protein L12E/L44/L45/RPP1/RPP2
MQAAGIQPGGQVSLGVAQRTVLGNPGGATNLVGAAAALQIAPQKRGRVSFRSALARRQADATQGQAGQAQIDPTTGQPIQQGAGQQIDPVTGLPIQQGQAAQLQQGTPTANNPVATQLLLEPTFTPVQANVVLDTANMRIAFPVSQLDGEFILTMKTGAAAAAAPAAAANATAPAARMVKRQDAAADAKPALGEVTVTMEEVNRMVDSQMWGGQAPVTQMMSEYVKANNGTAA